jgi:ubiquitin-activating enzyme E1
MEVAKCIILTGPKKVCVVDENIVDVNERFSNWVFRDEHINKIRSQAYLGDLQSLSPSAFTEVERGTPGILEDTSTIKKYDVVIACGEYNLEYIKSINQKCREARSTFILINNMGFYGHIFVEIPNLKVFDKYHGGINDTFYIRDITNEAEGLVNVSRMHPHFLQDGDYVSFMEVEGMNEVNGPECRPIKVKDPFSFTIENTSRYGKYKRGGVCTYMRIPQRFNCTTFEENLERPLFSYNPAKSEHGQMDLHIATLAYYDLVELRKHDPSLRDNSKLDKRIEMAFLDIAEKNPIIINLLRDSGSENFKVVSALKMILKNENLIMLPIAKLIASLGAFQIIPPVGKFYPIMQNLYFHFNDEYPISLLTSFQMDQRRPLTYHFENFGNENRHIVDHQNLKVGFIGAGSKAVETIKLMAMMGFGSGPQSVITIVSDSKISISDFPSHGIYKMEDIGQYKAEVLKKTIKKRVPECKIEVITSTEIFQNPAGSQMLWNSVEFMITSVDEYHIIISLLDKATACKMPLVVIDAPILTITSHMLIPYLDTEADVATYRRKLIQKMEQANININSLVLSFPTLMNHCVLWAMSVFTTVFTKYFYMLIEFSQDPARFIENLEQSPPKEGSIDLHVVLIIEALFLEKEKKKYSDCVDIASSLMMELFYLDICSLLNRHPPESRKNEEELFWEGKRIPEPLRPAVEDRNTPIFHFVESTTELLLQMLGIEDEPENSIKQQIILQRIQGFEDEQTQPAIENISELRKENFAQFKANVKNRIPNNVKLQKAIDLEDKVHRGMIVQFITAAANLRGSIFKIGQTSKHKVEAFIYKIKPNLNLTSSMAGALATMDLVKAVSGINKSMYRVPYIYPNLGQVKFETHEDSQYD